ncbi:MAG: hypothetical protein OXF55_02645 [Caldilineaceae bacterium]|nr:hypothetical protein [Caldilineaceae bacterium]
MSPDREGGYCHPGVNAAITGTEEHLAVRNRCRAQYDAVRTVAPLKSARRCVEHIQVAVKRIDTGYAVDDSGRGVDRATGQVTLQLFS